jgi:hypothetical protein
MSLFLIEKHPESKTLLWLSLPLARAILINFPDSPLNVLIPYEEISRRRSTPLTSTTSHRGLSFSLFFFVGSVRRVKVGHYLHPAISGEHFSADAVVLRWREQILNLSYCLLLVCI